MTTLKEFEETKLYRPDSGEPFAFLCERPTDPPKELPLEDTWSRDGTPRYVGYHVFLEALPDVSTAKALAADLRRKLPPDPPTTGFAWASSLPQPFALLGVVSMEIEGGPVVAADAPIHVRPPMPALTIPRHLVGQADPGLAGWTLFDGGGQPGIGIRVPLLGTWCGDIQFQALLESRVSGEQTVKGLADVRIDPLRLFDPDRTSVVPLGPEYRVCAGPAGTYHISSVR